MDPHERLTITVSKDSMKSDWLTYEFVNGFCFDATRGEHLRAIR